MNTGITIPSSLAVAALKALQNSMMLTPCWESAGPTGGEGLALPAWSWSLIFAVSFFAISRLPLLGYPPPALDPLHLEVVELDRGRPAEDADHHAQLAAFLVDGVHRAREVRERPVGDAHALADAEAHTRLRPLLGARGLDDLLDLRLAQRRRVRAAADEAGDARG